MSVFTRQGFVVFLYSSLKLSFLSFFSIVIILVLVLALALVLVLALVQRKAQAEERTALAEERKALAEERHRMVHLVLVHVVVHCPCPSVSCRWCSPYPLSLFLSPFLSLSVFLFLPVAL